MAPAPATVLELSVDGADSGGPFVLSAGAGGERIVIARGLVRFRGSMVQGPTLDLTAFRARCRKRMTGREIHERLAQRGLQYGPTFQLLDSVWVGEREALGEFQMPVSATTLPLARLAVLDAAMQIAATWENPAGSGSWVPFHVEKVEFLGDPLAVRLACVTRPGPATNHATEIDAILTDEQGLTLVEVQQFCARPWQTDGSAASELSFFTPAWAESSLDSKGAAPLAGRALVFHSMADANLAEALRAVHRDVNEIVLGGAFQQLGDRHHEIDAHVEEDFHAVLTAMPSMGVIYFVSRASSLADRDDPARLERTATQNALALLRLFRVLCRQGRLAAPLAIRIVTWDVHAVRPADRVQPEDGALAGLCRSLAMEFPQTDVCCIDLARADNANEQFRRRVAESLACETAVLPEREVAWRSGIRYVSQLTPTQLPPAAATSLPLRERGVYWIIGGAGGLGAVFARHLAGRFHARVALTGRRKDHADSESLVREIERLGGEAIYRAVDATDLPGMQAFVAEVNERWGALHGVIHSALILKNAGLARMTEGDFLEVLAPKLSGQRIVSEQALRTRPIDFVVLFSSAIALTGGPGQGNYAAGSSFLDAFGRTRILLGGKRCSPASPAKVGKGCAGGLVLGLPHDQLGLLGRNGDRGATRDSGPGRSMGSRGDPLCRGNRHIRTNFIGQDPGDLADQAVDGPVRGGGSGGAAPCCRSTDDERRNAPGGNSLFETDVR